MQTDLQSATTVYNTVIFSNLVCVISEQALYQQYAHFELINYI